MTEQIYRADAYQREATAKVLSVNDGLPKMKDFPKEMGGSGVTLPE